MPGSTLTKWFFGLLLFTVIALPEFRDAIFSVVDDVVELLMEFLEDVWGLLF